MRREPEPQGRDRSRRPSVRVEPAGDRFPPPPGVRRRRLALRLGVAMAHGRGQSTVEYALVLLGAAAVALLLVSWVTGTDVVGRLFDAVFGRILRQAA
jgi:hypothetical protein